MIVLQRCPVWKGFVILGLLNSMMTFLPAPLVFVPYPDTFLLGVEPSTSSACLVLVAVIGAAAAICELEGREEGFERLWT